MANNFSEGFGRSYDFASSDAAISSHEDPLATTIGDSILANGTGLDQFSMDWSAAEELNLADVESSKAAMSHISAASDPATSASRMADHSLAEDFDRLDAVMNFQQLAEMLNGVANFAIISA